MPHAKRKPFPPVLRVGSRVCVRRGVADPNYPAMPIGGWAGTIINLSGEPDVSYLVRWTRETLQAMPSICRELCQEDDFVLEEMWLEADDLVCDAASPAPRHGLRPAFLDRRARSLLAV